MISFQNETRIVIYSNKYQESRRFYEEILEIEVIKDWDHGSGELGVVYAFGTTCLEILQSSKATTPGDFYIYSQVKDIDLLWEKLKDKVKVINKIDTQPWGHRNFAIQDPNNYQLKFFSLV